MLEFFKGWTFTGTWVSDEADAAARAAGPADAGKVRRARLRMRALEEDVAGIALLPDGAGALLAAPLAALQALLAKPALTVAELDQATALLEQLDGTLAAAGNDGPRRPTPSVFQFDWVPNWASAEGANDRANDGADDGADDSMEDTTDDSADDILDTQATASANDAGAACDN